jgi:hypothetical protein
MSNKAYFDNDLDGKAIYDADFSDIDTSDFYSSFIGYEKAVKKSRGKLKRVLVPDDRDVIIEGVDNFILNPKNDGLRNIGYYKGKKLKELVFTINNLNNTDIEIDLFDPSSRMDFLFSESSDINDKIQVNGDNIRYSDVLYNILANPTHIVNARLVVADNDVLRNDLSKQISQPLMFKNKNIDGQMFVNPLNINLHIGNTDYARDIVNFDIQGTLNRPFIPDGMDIAKYKICANYSVTFCFYYRQYSLKKFFIKEARDSKIIL